MVHNFSLCIGSIVSGARIHTSSLDTGPCTLALRFQETLAVSPALCRLPEVALVSQGLGLNGSFDLGLCHNWLLGEPGKWISHSARWTVSDGVVILGFAHRKHTTVACQRWRTLALAAPWEVLTDPAWMYATEHLSPPRSWCWRRMGLACSAP